MGMIGLPSGLLATLGASTFSLGGLFAGLGGALKGLMGLIALAIEASSWVMASWLRGLR